MNSAVRASLEKKNLARRIRLNAIEPNPNYDEFLMDPESSKAFGFPDNTAIRDPDTSLLNNSTGPHISQKAIISNPQLRGLVRKDAGKVSSNLATDRY